MELTDRKHIFISYHSSKTELAAHLSAFLERNEMNTWYAARNIRSGEQWDQSIHEAIKHAEAVVLLFCAQADSSPQIKRELSLADKYKKPVFWVRVERVEPNFLSYFLTSTQWFDWLDTRDSTLEHLVNDIRSHRSVGFSKDSCAAPQAPYIASAKAKKWVKGVLAFDTDRVAGECVARVCFTMAQRNPDSTIVLPTGRSATVVFRSMMRIAHEYEGCPFGEAHLISDTETFGVWSEHETSRTRHIYDMLIQPLKRVNRQPDDSQLHFLSGIYTDCDPVKSAQKVIRMYPPVVHALSVSPVGEILAYEVGTYNDVDEIIDDVPRIVEVGEHSKKYIDPNQPSKSIITIGMGTALSSDILLILAFDLNKAGIVRRLLTGTITAGIPATLLQRHPNAYIITTKNVVSEAEIEDYVTQVTSPKEAAEWIVKN